MLFNKNITVYNGENKEKYYIYNVFLQLDTGKREISRGITNVDNGEIIIPLNIAKIKNGDIEIKELFKSKKLYVIEGEIEEDFDITALKKKYILLTVKGVGIYDFGNNQHLEVGVTI